jgi:hypothetical protein
MRRRTLDLGDGASTAERPAGRREGHTSAWERTPGFQPSATQVAGPAHDGRRHSLPQPPSLERRFAMPAVIDRVAEYDDEREGAPPLPTPNVALLDEVLAYITANPSVWDQRMWRCGTTACFAGHAALRTGATWAHPEDKNETDLLATAEDIAAGISFREGERDLVDVEECAKRALGISWREADELFSGGNTLGDLYDRVREIKARALDLVPA